MLLIVIDLGDGDYRPRIRRFSRNQSGKHLELEILKHRNMTVITPTIAKIAKSLFSQQMIIVGRHLKRNTDDEVGTECTDDDRTPSPFVHSASPNIRWGKPLLGYPGYYKSVFLDEIEYRVGRSNVLVDVHKLK